MTDPSTPPDADPDSNPNPNPDADPDARTGTGTETDFSLEEAAAVRAAFDPDERERVEGTVVALLDLLGRAHAMAVLSEFAFAEGPLRFGDLESRLDVAPNTLSARLKELTAAGLLDRRAYDEVPPRVEYTPMRKAETLFPVFAHLHHWAVEHDL